MTEAAFGGLPINLKEVLTMTREENQRILTELDVVRNHVKKARWTLTEAESAGLNRCIAYAADEYAAEAMRKAIAPVVEELETLLGVVVILSDKIAASAASAHLVRDMSRLRRHQSDGC